MSCMVQEEKMIKLMKSTFYKEEKTKKELCNFIMNSKYLSMDKKCSEFEKKFSSYQERKYSVFFNSGSSANLALVQALVNLGLIKKNDNAGFSALTWATNIMPLMQLGISPIPIDVSLNNLNVCSDNLLDVLKKTKLNLLFITNLLGFCGDLDKIAEICEKKGIILIEDNCESLGSSLKNKKLGNFGIASTFSFFVGHHLSTIEGGMVCTDNTELYDMLLMVRSHGWNRNLSENEKSRLRKKYSIGEFYDQYSFYYPAYNFRPTEINGFLGVEQLRYIEDVNKKRNKNYKEFDRVAKRNPDFYHLDLSHIDFVSNFAYPVVCKNKKLFELYVNKFKESSIEIRPIVGGSMTNQPFFKNYPKKNDLKYLCPNAEKIHELGFYFPNNPELTENEKRVITSALKKD